MQLLQQSAFPGQVLEKKRKAARLRRQIHASVKLVTLTLLCHGAAR